MTSSNADLVDAAQRVAGLLAARSRDNVDDAATLLSTFADDRELAAGALTLGQVLLTTHADALALSPEQVAQDVTQRLESARTA